MFLPWSSTQTELSEALSQINFSACKVQVSGILSNNGENWNTLSIMDGITQHYRQRYSILPPNPHTQDLISKNLFQILNISLPLLCLPIISQTKNLSDLDHVDHLSGLFSIVPTVSFL